MSINTPEELRGQLRTINTLDGDMSASGKIIASKIGQKGDTGDPGEAATIEVGTVTTVSPSTPASVTNVGTATNAVFNFEIPKGQDGSGGGETWGSITGTLTDQTDLKNALDDKIGKSLTAGFVKNDGTIDTTTYSTFSGNYSDLTGTPTIPDNLADLSDDSTHRLVTDTEKTTWNNKSNFSGNYSDLSGKPTIPTVNDKKITIQKNGTNVDYFTTNNSANKTINITVPTKTSELTNNSGFITNSVDNLTNYTLSSSLTNVAITGEYDDLIGKPNLDREFGTKYLSPITSQTTTTPHSTPVAITNASITLTTSGRNVFVAAEVPISVTGNMWYLYLYVDGTQYCILAEGDNSTMMHISGFTVVSGLSAGSHTFALYFASQRDNQTTTVKNYNTISFVAYEI